MPVWAEEILRDRGASLPANDLESLMILATGDREKAEDERVKRQLQEMRRGKGQG